MSNILLTILLALHIINPVPPQVNTEGLCTVEIVVTEQTVPERASIDAPLSEELQAALFEVCNTYEVEPALALALIETESDFRTDALNASSGCYGLCQLNPCFFPANLSPAKNIEHGIRYLSENINRYGDTAAALCAYNAGHDTGDRGYANLVLSRAAEWEDKL